MGCYATSPNDYSDFHGFFDSVIRDYHGDTSGKKTHVTDWNTDKDTYDVKNYGIDHVSMRVRVGRNLEGFNLPAAMTKEMRIFFEKKMVKVFEKLGGGTYHSLSPDFGENEPNPNLISDEAYKALVEEHVMFKDMSADPYLNSAGISNDWPYGRGCWTSDDKKRIIWVGEEDQLRIMSMKQGTDLLEVFKELKDTLERIENIDDVKFASHKDYGYITSCPSNLGTGMRASVHVKVPTLTSDGTDTMLKQLCKPLGLSVRGTGGEHTPIVDGMVDISPSSRLFTSECEIISTLYSGIKEILSIENKVLSNIENLDAYKANNSLENGAEVLAKLNDAEETCSAVTKPTEQEYRHVENGNLDVSFEGRDDDENKGSIQNIGADTINYIIIENEDRDKEERESAAEQIEKKKERKKSEKQSIPVDRSISNQSPRSLQLSPSPQLSIANE